MQINNQQLIMEISEMRQSRVICYICGDRQNVSTRIAPDIIPVFYNHLEQFGPSEKIDLFLFTKGGDVHTALRLVQLIYEYTKNFSVLIPYQAYSAGTLVCLGASEIVMTKMAELGPVDPNVTSVFNPEDPRNPSVKLPINVEDVYSFFALAKEILGTDDLEGLARMFSRLIDHVHPLALGTVYRTYALIRAVAKKLLLTHMEADAEPEINEIVASLTEKFFSHSYTINRVEAKDALHLPVTFCHDELENKIWQLYEQYRYDLMLEKPFIPEINAGDDGRFSVCCGIIESTFRTDGYMFEGMVQRMNVPDPVVSDNVNIIDQGWKEIAR